MSIELLDKNEITLLLRETAFLWFTIVFYT